MTPVCCMLEILVRYDSNESTTAFTSASRASEMLQESERSMAAQTDRQGISEKSVTFSS